MTRFEALGLLPNKRIVAYTRRDDKLLHKVFTTDPISFIEQLPPVISAKIAIRKDQPQLGYLIKLTMAVRDGIKVGYFRADQRKVKKAAKNWPLTLPKFPVPDSLNRPTTSVRA